MERTESDKDTSPIRRPNITGIRRTAISMTLFYRRILTTTCAAIAILPLAWNSTHAAEVIKIRTAAQANTEPKYILQSQDGKNSVVGLCIDINRAIERIDPGIRFVGDQNWRPAIRVEAEMAHGNIDAECGLSRTKERESKFTYIEPPLFLVKYHLVARADDDVQIRNWEDVRKMGDDGIILTIHGFGPVNRLKEMGDLVIDSSAVDSKTNLLKLLAGRGRFYYHRSPGIVTEIRKAGVEGRVKLLPTVMDKQQFHMVVGKTLSAEGVEKLQKAIATLEKNGELKRLINKWYEE